jgi:hypothetical protein
MDLQVSVCQKINKTFQRNLKQKYRKKFFDEFALAREDS